MWGLYFYLEAVGVAKVLQSQWAARNCLKVETSKLQIRNPLIRVLVLESR